MIRRIDGKYVLFSSDGKRLGTHTTRQAAAKQEAAIQASKVRQRIGGHSQRHEPREDPKPVKRTKTSEHRMVRVGPAGNPIIVPKAKKRKEAARLLKARKKAKGGAAKMTDLAPRGWGAPYGG